MREIVQPKVAFLLGCLVTILLFRNEMRVRNPFSSTSTVHVEHNIAAAAAEPVPVRRRQCEWNGTLDDCGELLSPILFRNRTAVDLNANWHFFGDSTMWRMTRELAFLKPFGTPYQRSGGTRCDRLAYINKILKSRLGGYGGHIFSTKNWTQPDPLKAEGPVHFGKDNPMCTDCSGCNTVRTHLHRPSFEYMATEYARDVELPSVSTTTTIETISLYLHRLNETGSVCVANAGLHDMGIAPVPSTEMYLENVLDYVKQLSLSCTNIIWIGMSATLDNPIAQQRNSLIALWNEAVYEGIAKLFPRVYVINLYNQSLGLPHLDNVHLNNEYYRDLAGLFVPKGG